MTMVTEGPRLGGPSCREPKPLLPTSQLHLPFAGRDGPWRTSESEPQSGGFSSLGAAGPPWGRVGRQGGCVCPQVPGERGPPGWKWLPAPQLAAGPTPHPGSDLLVGRQDSGQGVPKPFFYEQEARYESVLSGRPPASGPVLSPSWVRGHVTLTSTP